ncbi:hypothetical protein CARUB_v10018705mg [Capsella rubella]|uniref:MATH domain-containing protein n=1 Tax=Capsella rubella TaxID=81985 RepID=R0H7T3_9BRAS|nr:MATH domain and coiled-coil domain-containing protein At3g58380 [Capsella rubella]XP_023639211.1 MATH domain and coiled-coil domain-containing protein At3g58380 [Capsella rubella]EOA25374.1 hypothetical protein CARUB_v10018705mg [Capsella rubella]
MEKQVEKNFVWVIKNLSICNPKLSHSDPFVIAGSKWSLVAIPKGTNFEFFYQYMGVADDCCQSLTSTCRRHVKLRLTIVNGISQKRSLVTDSDIYFDENLPTRRYPTVAPPSNLLERDAGYLVRGQVTVVVEVVALEFIGTSGKSDKQSIDVNGFQVLPSQVKSVIRIFEKYPDIASEVRVKNPCLRTTYMNVVLGIIETLCQLPMELSDNDLDEASASVSYVAQCGFKVDWLKKKLAAVKAKKHQADTSKACLQDMEENMQLLNEKYLELKGLMEKVNASLLDTNVALSFNDVV